MLMISFVNSSELSVVSSNHRNGKVVVVCFFMPIKIYANIHLLQDQHGL